ncbi:hypothetical protein AVEN_227022-1 [Araneus ventricosus]|uniref:Uncharacterized protein n=1 Tax=Araneus ventricosus TaxID=182803 RepID=A0A4Y2WA73_ARAVE|nr:hypothetical protein AVEN_227022-1 [Araneus ventricosus]
MGFRASWKPISDAFDTCLPQGKNNVLKRWPRYLHMREMGDPLHYATSCHMTLSYHFAKPSAENAQLWCKSVLSNKLSRIHIAKLIYFLTENENLIKQPPDATSSSDSDPDFSPSPRPQT